MSKLVKSGSSCVGRIALSNRAGKEWNPEQATTHTGPDLRLSESSYAAGALRPGKFVLELTARRRHRLTALGMDRMKGKKQGKALRAVALTTGAGPAGCCFCGHYHRLLRSGRIQNCSPAPHKKNPGIAPRGNFKDRLRQYGCRSLNG